MKKFLALGLAWGLGLLLADGASAQVRLGVGGPMTGGVAAFGAQLRQGAEQAVADINAQGGILPGWCPESEVRQPAAQPRIYDSTCKTGDCHPDSDAPAPLDCALRRHR